MVSLKFAGGEDKQITASYNVTFLLRVPILALPEHTEITQ